MDLKRVGSGGHTVLVLHGWFGSSRSWQAFLPHLDREAFSYVFLDYRGYGSRRGETGEFTLAETAADVLAAADELGADRFSLLGHSMGGTVMQRVYADAPERVRALVGVSPVPASGVPFDEQSRQLFHGAADSPDNRRAIIDLTTGNRLTSIWLDAMVRHSLDHSDREAFAAYLPAWSGTDFHTEIAGSDVPIQVIAGRHDPALGARDHAGHLRSLVPEPGARGLPRRRALRDGRVAGGAGRQCRAVPEEVLMTADAAMPDVFDPRVFTRGIPHESFRLLREEVARRLAGRARSGRLAGRPRLLGRHPLPGRARRAARPRRVLVLARCHPDP